MKDINETTTSYNDTEEKTHFDFLSGKFIDVDRLYTRMIDTLVENIRNNYKKNILPTVNDNEQALAIRNKIPPEYREIIALLWNSTTDITVGQLAKSLSVTNNNLTPKLNKMETEGYIRREISKTSRRCVNVYLTKKSISNLLEYLNYVHPIFEEKIMSVLDKDEIRDMIKMLCKINYYLNRFDEKNKIYHTKSEEHFEKGLDDKDFVIDDEDIDNDKSLNLQYKNFIKEILSESENR